MKIKDTLILYLQHRVIIFPLHLYINVLLNNVFSKIDEWGLLKESKKISGREKFFKFFLEKEIENILSTFQLLFKKLNIKIITVFKNQDFQIDYINFIKDKKELINIINKIFSKKTKYFIKKIPENLLIEPSNFSYKDLKVGLICGEIEEFFSSLKIFK